MATQNDQEFLELVIKSIVDNPKDVKIDRTVDEMGVLLTLRVHADDMAQVIGRQGSTARSIRTLLRIVGMKNNARVNLKIEEPEGSTRVMPARKEETAPESAAPDVEGAVGDL
ncbi:MAG: KH domain-containing protein, partial [Candidatus Spechtbacteria bacterium]|nr:KH domain-containing protein [Candidatus Spechtbacteria bacterium]